MQAKVCKITINTNWCIITALNLKAYIGINLKTFLINKGQSNILKKRFTLVQEIKGVITIVTDQNIIMRIIRRNFTNNKAG